MGQPDATLSSVPSRPQTLSLNNSGATSSLADLQPDDCVQHPSVVRLLRTLLTSRLQLNSTQVAGVSCGGNSTSNSTDPASPPASGVPNAAPPSSAAGRSLLQQQTPPPPSQAGACPDGKSLATFGLTLLLPASANVTEIM
jgi:hypothetical protein